MARHSDAIRLLLAQGTMSARQVIEKTGISQPTLSRALAALGEEIVRIGAGPTIRYALRDTLLGFSSAPVFRVNEAGVIAELGTLVPVRPSGFVMIQTDGVRHYSERLPWWLFDMRPQGYLGRAYASNHAAALGLPGNPKHWSDTEVIRALLAHDHDAIGNLLIGERSRERFINLPPRLARCPAHPQGASSRSSAPIPHVAMC